MIKAPMIYSAKDNMLKNLLQNYSIAEPFSITEEDLEDVTSIKPYFFINCNVINIEIPDTVGSIGIYSFSYTPNLETLILGTGITSIPNYCIQNSSVKNVIINGNIVDIGTYAFSSCSRLTSINLPNSLETLASLSFYNSGLTEVTIPENVYSFGNNVFRSCVNLLTIKMLPIDPPAMSNATGLSQYTTRIEVPMASLTAYQTATNWSLYANLMVGV